MSARLVCFGELLWDMLPSGKVAGGAPFNITNRANALGLASTVISCVGRDELGEELLQLVQRKGNDISYIQKHVSLPTSQVIISVGHGGEPNYNIVHPVAWDDIVITEEIVNLVRGADAFIYSSLGLRDERSRSTLFSLLAHAQLKICDINLREGHYHSDTIKEMLKHADILRMNEFELQMITELLEIKATSLEEQLSSIYKIYNYKTVIATLGADGAVAYDGIAYYTQHVFKVEVEDTVGAGDAFLAAYTSSILQHNNQQEALRFGAAVGSLTASKHGGTPDISEEEIVAILKN